MDFDTEQALARLKVEYIESCAEKLSVIDDTINRIFAAEDAAENADKETGDDISELTYEIRRDVHSIKGSAGTYGFHAASTIAHRLEDFLESSTEISRQHWLMVQNFIDEIRAIIESGKDQSEDESQKTLDRLSLSIQPVAEAQKGSPVTLLLVMPKGVQRKMVGTQLTAEGYDISYADSPVQAIGTAISVHPRAILSNKELPEFDGMELSAVFRAIRATEDIPFIVMTSNKSRLSIKVGEDINMHVILKDKDFMDNLTRHLTSLSLADRA